MSAKLRVMTCKPSATCVTPSTTANTWSAVPIHRNTTSANYHADQVKQEYSQDDPGNSQPGRISSAMVAKTMTAAIP